MGLDASSHSVSTRDLHFIYTSQCRASGPSVKRNVAFSPQVLLNQLRAVFDQVIELQSAQDAVCRAALEELQRRLRFEEKQQQREVEVRLSCQWVGGLH